MITTKKILQEYLETESSLYPKVSGNILRRWKNRLVTTPQSTQWYIYSYVKNLRYAEYHKNNSIMQNSIRVRSICHTILMLYRFWILRKLSFKTGFQIDPGSFGKGLMIYHYGSIIVNAGAKIGDFTTIYPGVLIGAKDNVCPVVGNNCFIGSDAKILGG